jgi:hypothetical protein
MHLPGFALFALKFKAITLIGSWDLLAAFLNVAPFIGCGGKIFEAVFALELLSVV